MTNAYEALRKRQQQEVNDFPMMFAFDQKQFEEGMARLGLRPTDKAKVYSIGLGGFIRKTDVEAYLELYAKHIQEIQAAIEADATGDGFIFDMFTYELANHEYGYTGAVQPTLDALGLSAKGVDANPKLKHGLQRAQRSVLSAY